MPKPASPSQTVSLPFVLISTQDTLENEVEISFGEKNQTMNIAMKKQMNFIGDVDALMKLGMYKVKEDWLHQNVPECESVLRALS